MFNALNLLQNLHLCLKEVKHYHIAIKKKKKTFEKKAFGFPKIKFQRHLLIEKKAK